MTNSNFESPFAEYAEELERLQKTNEDLLEACEAAYDWLSRYGEHNPTANGSETSLGMMLFKAIAKAKGNL